MELDAAEKQIPTELLGELQQSILGDTVGLLPTNFADVLLSVSEGMVPCSLRKPCIPGWFEDVIIRMLCKHT